MQNTFLYGIAEPLGNSFYVRRFQTTGVVKPFFDIILKLFFRHHPVRYIVVVELIYIRQWCLVLSMKHQTLNALTVQKLCQVLAEYV